MQTLNNVHEQFAEFFKGKHFRPFAHLLSKKLSEGHICLSLKEMISEEVEISSRYTTLTELEKQLADEHIVGMTSADNQPFVVHNSHLYIQRYYYYETLIFERIKDFVFQETEEMQHRIELINLHRDFIKGFSVDEELADTLSEEEKVDWQLVGAILGFLNNFTIITGGPGTGKTTTVSKILKLLKHIDPNLKIGIAAPTGKAAMRLAESLEGETPTTIHRMLKTIYGSHHFKHNRENPLDFDLIIVDEASMIDVALFAKLLDAIRPNTRLILLGDKDQLASVEAGSLFRDLCQIQENMNVISAEKAKLINSLRNSVSQGLPDKFVSDRPLHFLSDHIVELKRSRRFDSKKGIGKLSKAIILNRTESLDELFEPAPDNQVQLVSDFDLFSLRDFINGYECYIKEADTYKALEKFNELRILCAVRGGDHGLYQINKLVEDELKSRRLIDTDTEFYNNRPIIITKNYYDLELYNGDIGIIRPDANNKLMAWFADGEGGLRAVIPGLLAEAETVFAMTVHKSQGSEYNSVLIVIPDLEDSQLLTRELLYTAITRAKLKVTLMASKEAIVTMMNRTVKRVSGIKDRFNLEIERN